ncbi:TetR/AcrR family transcriptional regulator C-terminal domain-containing protein [Lacticaseibacillus sp. N501-2]|uniref:TetR/AcrR family transcriptional regulator C-terminal domain-containing protein n=1 Tax=Lacticaseibacillus salsurae TaxID=3367729 RepID=UPI0038B37096
MDQKIVATEDKIKQAFIALMKTKPFEKLTVSDITKAAKINRGTFYLHYVDKYALLAHYEADLTTRLAQFFQADFADTMIMPAKSQAKTYPVVEEVVGLVASEFDLFKVLLGPAGDPRFEYQLKKMVRAAISQRLHQLKNRIALTPDIPVDYAWELIISGLFSIIQTWLQAAEPETPETVCAIIMKTRFLSPYDLLGIHDGV